MAGCLAAAMLLASSCAPAGSAAGEASAAAPSVDVSADANASPAASVDPNASPTITPTPEVVDLSQYPAVPLPQLDPVTKGEEVAVLHTDFGDIKIRFFSQYAPKAVQNFKTLAKSGYYDNNTFNHVMENGIIQSGDPTGAGTGGQSIWGQGFDPEPTLTLHNIYGAVSMVHGQDSALQGSQFFIVANKTLDDATKTQMESYKDEQNVVALTTSDGTKVPFSQLFPTQIIDKYIQDGGIPSFDLQYTVFGQVIDGFDAVDKIASVPTSQDTAKANQPLTDVKINSVSFENYEG